MVNKAIITVILLICCQTISFADAREGRRDVHNAEYAVRTRGVMECFGNVGDDLGSRLDFYAGLGMTHYFYSPSDDRYCNAWGWKFLYNDSDRHVLRSLMSECRKRGLEFVWTVSPGEGYSWSEKDYEFLLNKLVLMYYNGIKSFAARFSVKGRDYESLRMRLESDMKAKGLDDSSVRIIDMMPSISFPSAGNAAEALMRGYHFEDSFLKTVAEGDSFLCVIEEKSELSRTAAVAASEIARDPLSYDAVSGMAKGIETLSPEVKEPLMIFLEHTGGIHESESVETFSLEQWSPEKSAKLLEEFIKIEKVPAEMSLCSSPSLMDDLNPWLEEFGKLGVRGRKTIECLEYYQNGDLGAFWTAYMDSRMSDKEKEEYERHKVGEEKLHPFCVNMMRELENAFTVMLTGSDRLRNLASTLFVNPCPALDSDFTTAMNSSGHTEFPIPADANTCRLLTGALPERERVIFRQLGTDGSLLAEFVLRASYSEFDLKTGAVKVDIIGNVEIYESIFLYL